MSAKKLPKPFKITLWAVLSLIALIILVVAVYVIYISAAYYRTGDKALDIKNNSETVFSGTGEYSVLTYNIGFGAYSPEFSFFMDGGNDSVAKNKAAVDYNTQGAAELARALDVDFALFQEVDTNSTRSKKVNQYEAIGAKLNGFGSIFAENFHTPFLMYPVFKPHGKVNSGIAMFSKYKLDTTSAKRVELPVSTKWPAKLFDLDRCFSEVRIPVNGKELVVINIHLTAYDAGGTVRASQLEALETKLTQEKDNYVVIGGDFNHDLISTYGGNPEDYFDYTKPEEAWVQKLPDDFKDFLSENGYSFKYAVNEPSCRSSAYAYEEGISRVWAIDGFIVSDTINASSVEVVDGSMVEGYGNFKYSDHNPVLMKFSLA